MSLSSLDSSPQWVYCSALLFNREHTWNCLPAESPSQYIWLTSNLIFTDSICATRFMWRAFVWAAVVTLPLVCVKRLLRVLSTGGQACWGFSHVHEQTAATGSVPAQEQTLYKHLKYVLRRGEPHSLWCLSEDRRTLKSQNLVSCVQSFDTATQ